MPGHLLCPWHGLRPCPCGNDLGSQHWGSLVDALACCMSSPRYENNSRAEVVATHPAAGSDSHLGNWSKHIDRVERHASSATYAV